MILLAVLILIVACVTLGVARDVEIRTRWDGESFKSIHLELSEIKKMVEEIREKA